MSDYREEIRVSKEILARAVEAYRKIRNTLRYLVANLYDFDPATDRVPHGQLEEVDRYILANYAEVGQRILRGYEDYDYLPIFQALNAFTTVDLSAFYNDISKDRLYTFAARSRERRSAQTAMYLMADGLTRLMAPILSFTADELWRFLPGAREESVHIAVFPTRRGFPAAGRRRADRALGPAGRHPRARAGAHRAAAEGQADRQLAAGEGGHRGAAGRAVAARTLRRAICRCSSSSRRWS